MQMEELDMTKLYPHRIGCERMLFETYTRNTCADCAPLGQHLKKQLDEGKCNMLLSCDCAFVGKRNDAGVWGLCCFCEYDQASARTCA
jgi:hypothetical protein